MYIVSNSKDQTAKLWDLRALTSPAVHAARPPLRRRFEWDYRCVLHDAR